MTLTLASPERRRTLRHFPPPDGRRAARRYGPDAGSETPPRRRGFWRWGALVLAGLLLLVVAHGCHFDEDDEPGLAVPVERTR
jgi:hypothetical protein